MAKDPAFLFYSKDWLEGTAELSSEEKGVYIDLLAHQHQKGSLPAEPKKLAKLSGLSESDFSKIWVELCSKFIANASGRLVNRKLDGIVSERLDKGWRSTIIGTLGAIVRYSIQNEGKNQQIAEKAKKTFKVDDFLACTKENLTERITKWFSERYDKCYESIVNANGDANKEIKGVEFKFDLKTPLDGKTLESAELNQHTMTGNKNTSFIKSQWLVFLHERMNDPPEKLFQYQNIQDLTRYFLNWIRPKFPKNGTHKSGSANGVQDATLIAKTGFGTI